MWGSVFCRASPQDPGKSPPYIVNGSGIGQFFGLFQGKEHVGLVLGGV